MNNKFQQPNYYHSTFFGSYLAASNSTLEQIGLSDKERKCIGVDVWGNTYETLEDTSLDEVHKSCFGDKEVSIRDVIRPYILEPRLIVRIMSVALPIHGTTDYFHVDKDNQYLYVTDTKRTSSNNILLQAGKLRGQVSPLMAAVLCMMVCVVSFRYFPALGTASLFLFLFALSQVVICILGEGVRDLGRHLSGAQYAIDIALVLLFAQITSLVRNLWQSRSASLKYLRHARCDKG